MKLRLCFLSFLILASLSAYADDGTPFVDAKPGQYAEGQAVLIVLSESGDQKKFGVVVKAGEGSFRVFPAEMETEIPAGVLGRPSIIRVKVMDDTQNDRSPQRLVLRIQEIKPQQRLK